MPGRPRAPRRPDGPSQLLAFRRWELDPDGRVFCVDGEEVALTRTEFNILELLMARPQKVFTKQELFELAWGEPYSVEDSTVNVHVSNLRRKLKPTGTDGYLPNRVGHGLQTAQCLIDVGRRALFLTFPRSFVIDNFLAQSIGTRKPPKSVMVWHFLPS